MRKKCKDTRRKQGKEEGRRLEKGSEESDVNKEECEEKREKWDDEKKCKGEKGKKGGGRDGRRRNKKGRRMRGWQFVKRGGASRRVIAEHEIEIHTHAR